MIKNLDVFIQEEFRDEKESFVIDKWDYHSGNVGCGCWVVCGLGYVDRYYGCLNSKKQ